MPIFAWVLLLNIFACKFGIEGIPYHLPEILFKFYVGSFVVPCDLELFEDFS